MPVFFADLDDRYALTELEIQTDKQDIGWIRWRCKFSDKIELRRCILKTSVDCIFKNNEHTLLSFKGIDEYLKLRVVSKRMIKQRTHPRQIKLIQYTIFERFDRYRGL